MSSKRCVYNTFIIQCLLILNSSSQSYQQDPWDYERVQENFKNQGFELPSDFHASNLKPGTQCVNNCAAEEWFFRRIFAILVKGGQVKVDDDGDTHVSIQMKFTKVKWKVIGEYIDSNSAFTEEKYRRSIGYLEEAIYRPSLVETVVLTWREYFVHYLEEYREVIKWSSGTASVILASVFLWNRMSQRHVYLLLFLLLYFYEAFISYKEAEQQEYEKFISSLNKCKWFFWTSHCEVAAPDPMLFLKHMHPLKIGLRIFTMLVSEPIITISSTVKVMVDGLTDGLWFPFDKIVYIVLVVLINIFLIMSLIMVLFNFILNIPFNLSFFAGLINFGVRQRRSRFSAVNPQPQSSSIEGDRISGPNLDKLLSFCARAVNHSKKTESRNTVNVPRIKAGTMKKSASTGRLANLDYETSENYKYKFKHQMGSGDS